ncbi:hypothetical protein ACSBR2_010268 [Camellia fascicularis]
MAEVIESLKCVLALHNNIRWWKETTKAILSVASVVVKEFDLRQRLWKDHGSKNGQSWRSRRDHDSKITTSRYVMLMVTV